MATHSLVSSHIDTTDTLLRLYLFLEQAMDRVVDEAARAHVVESELNVNLANARSVVSERFSVNRVVRGKIEAECNRIRSLIETCLAGGVSHAAALQALNEERAIMKQKTMVLSDLLAVFRAA